MPRHSDRIGHGASIEVDDEAGTYELVLTYTTSGPEARFKLSESEYSAIWDLPDGDRLRHVHELARARTAAAK